MLLSGLTSATNYYINHSAPAPTQAKDGTPPPPPPRALLLLSHPRTHQTLSRAYAISGQAVKVSSKTVDIVEGLIKRAVGASDKGKATASSPSTQTRPQSSTAPPAQSAPSVSSDAPPPYPGTSAAPTPDGKPPLPPRRNAAPGAGAAPPPGPAPPLPPRSKSPLPGSQATTTPSAPASGTSTPGTTPRPVKTKDKLLLSANLILSTVDDSIKRTFDVGSERVSAVVAHKYGPEAGRSTHLATHTARNVTLVYIDMRGFARKALIKRAGKHWLKARVGGGREMSGTVVDKQEQPPKN